MATSNLLTYRAATDDRSLRGRLLRLECAVRTHPAWVGAFTVVSVAAIAIERARVRDDQAEIMLLSISPAVPLVLCAYGVGPIAGACTAVAFAVIWLGGVLGSELRPDEMALGFIVRLLGNLVLVGMSAVAAAAARARERYDEGQQELAETRADLVAAFSHDLRGPLFAITGYAEMLRDGGYTSQSLGEHELTKRILTNANHLDRLVVEMLDAGRGEGEVRLDAERFTADDLVKELVPEFDQVRRDDVTLVWQASPGLEPFQTDRIKLTSIVRNLVRNALKFTVRGSVTVRFSYLPEAGVHRVEVEDTGPGIPEEALAHIFERYFQVGRKRRIPGFGLGLFIAKRFAEMLGGSIEVRSRIGRGTTFTVTVPGLAPEPALPGG